MAYKMTARRRAALKKAQAASARKRRKGGRAAAKSYRQKRAANVKRLYRKQPGGLYRMNVDRYHSRGPVFSRNSRGKKYGKGMKRVNKVASAAIMGYGANPLVLGASYARGRRAGTIKKKRR